MSEEEKELLKEAEEIITANKNIPGGMEIIKTCMNKIYKYFKKVIKKASFDDERLIEIFKLERMLENDFLPLNSEPIYDPKEIHTIPKQVTNEKDCESMMRYIVHQTRSRLSKHNNLKNDSLENLCINTSYDVESICKELGVNQKCFWCSENLSSGTFHCFNVVDFILPTGDTKYYLVDCTYRQFFTYSESFLERIGMPLNEGANIGTFMMMDESRKKIAEEILTNGYIEFTPEVIKKYFDGFIFSGRNGKYYESLGKTSLTKTDYEPFYSCEDYLYALTHEGISERYIGRQFDIMKEQIDFEIIDNINIKNK